LSSSVAAVVAPLLRPVALAFTLAALGLLLISLRNALHRSG
jgi:hypothetical protein